MQNIYILYLHSLFVQYVGLAPPKSIGMVGELGLFDLTNGLFIVVSVLISFGALIGKVSVKEMLFITMIEPIFIVINNCIGNGAGTPIHAMDTGGSIFIHLFGALFGLAISYVKRFSSLTDSNGSSYFGDQSAMIGTLFLLIGWPSFNGAVAIYTGDGGRGQAIAMINTVLALSGGTVVAIITSRLFRGKFAMVDVQNATLAAGTYVRNLIIRLFLK